MEEFFKNYEYTIAALGVAATLIASIVALLVAYRKPKPCIEARLQIKTHGDYFGGKRTVDFYFVTISILNTGSQVVEIHEDSFKDNEDIVYPLDVTPTDYTGVPHPAEDIVYKYYGEKGETKVYYPLSEFMKKYPVCIHPRRSENFYIWSIDSYFQIIEKGEIPDYSNIRIVLDITHSFGIKGSNKFNKELKGLIGKLQKERDNKKIKK